MSDGERRLVLVVGVGRSGTSLLAGILGQLGFHIPQPEVKADDTNPRGFGEPQWVVGFHRPLLRKARVTVFDSRPVAFERTREAGADATAHAHLREWLSEQLELADDVVVKDPRIGWFLPLWQASADELAARTSYVTMLRHPAEILLSAKRSYGEWQTDASRAASWVNEMLEIERATRGANRVFVRYEALMADWAGELRRAGEVLDLPRLHGLERADHPAVDGFVDPTLHRNRGRWEDLAVPERLTALADAVWEQLLVLAEPDGDAAAVGARLDALREDYAALYGEAEAIAQSSATALDPKRWKAKRQGARYDPSAPPPDPPLRVRLARRVPKRYRRRVRSALGAFRRS